MHPAYLKARMDDVRARDERGAPRTDREGRSAILGALADLGLPENCYVQDPSRPRSALYLYRADDGRHEVGSAPWRLARHAPPDMPPEDVRRVGNELRRGLIGSLSGFAVACLGALFLLVATAFVPSAPPESVSPAAYLHAAPAILGSVAALCAVGVFWHAVASLFPRAALREDAESRTALGRAMSERGHL